MSFQLFQTYLEDGAVFSCKDIDEKVRVVELLLSMGYPVLDEDVKEAVERDADTSYMHFCIEEVDDSFDPDDADFGGLSYYYGDKIVMFFTPEYVVKRQLDGSRPVHFKSEEWNAFLAEDDRGYEMVEDVGKDELMKLFMG